MDWLKIEYYEVTALAKSDYPDLPAHQRDLTRITFYGGERCIGAAHFFPDEGPLPDAEVEYVDGDMERPVITLAYPLSLLATVLNVIQHEKPVWLFHSGPGHCGLTTGKESTGEQEGGAFAAAERQRRRTPSR